MATFETGNSILSGDSIEDLKNRLSDLANEVPQESREYFSLELKKSKLRERIQKFDSIRRKTVYEMLIYEELCSYENGRFGTIPDAASYASNRLVDGKQLTEFENKLLIWKKLYSKQTKDG